jgi:hypothetical protein
MVERMETDGVESIRGHHTNLSTISLQQLEAAHTEFQKVEPRTLFYRVAIELIDLSLQGKTKFTLPEALAILLQTWNKALYRFQPFDEQHFSEIENIINAKMTDLLLFRKRSIEDFEIKDPPVVGELFCDFEMVLGPVGAAKSMHLLAPRFFPLWDRAIAKAYKIYLKKKGGNAALYIRFMEKTREQVKQVKMEMEQSGRMLAIDDNLLKAVDEFNYCTYTLPKEKRNRDKAAEKRRNSSS